MGHPSDCEANYAERRRPAEGRLDERRGVQSGQLSQTESCFARSPDPDGVKFPGDCSLARRSGLTRGAGPRPDTTSCAGVGAGAAAGPDGPSAGVLSY